MKRIKLGFHLLLLACAIVTLYQVSKGEIQPSLHHVVLFYGLVAINSLAAIWKEV